MLRLTRHQRPKRKKKIINKKIDIGIDIDPNNEGY